MIMGKGNRPDYTPDMMPKNRWELFFEMLRLNFLNLLKLNLMYFVFWKNLIGASMMPISRRRPFAIPYWSLEKR